MEDALKIPSPTPSPACINPTLKITAPTSSTAKVILAIWKSSLKVFRGESAFSVSSLTVSRRLNPIRCPMSRGSKGRDGHDPESTQLHDDHHHYLPEVGKRSGDRDGREARNGAAADGDEECIEEEIPSVVAHGSLRNAVPPATSARNP